jgi:hypothetical protein
MPDLDFEFYAGGIEDRILEVLKTPMQAIGVKGFTTYSGQLDSPDDLKRAIATQTLQYPFVMVSYAGGEMVKDPPTAPVLGRSLHFRHDCSFGVVVADDNPQGEKARRRNKAYQMISVVWNTLTGVRLKKLVAGEQILLNTSVLEPVENIPILLPDITAFGIVFDTAFKWSSPDRTVGGIDVEELIVGVDSINPLQVPESNLPGVEFES